MLRVTVIHTQLCKAVLAPASDTDLSIQQFTPLYRAVEFASVAVQLDCSKRLCVAKHRGRAHRSPAWLFDVPAQNLRDASMDLEQAYTALANRDRALSESPASEEGKISSPRNSTSLLPIQIEHSSRISACQLCCIGAPL